MGKKVDLTDMVFGRLTILQESIKRAKDGRVMWFCRCSCGRISLVRGSQLTRGRISSCGCLRDERTVSRSTKHGEAKRKHVNDVYFIWQGIKARCYNKNHISYERYGGRGIKMCDEWLNDFVCFNKDMGARPSKIHSVERIDVNLGYSKQNCYWATDIEQSKNKSSTKKYDFRGGRYSIPELAELLEVKRATLYHYLVIKNHSTEECYEFYKNKK